MTPFFSAYVSGPVLRRLGAERPLQIGLYDLLRDVAERLKAENEISIEMTFPAYSERLDNLSAQAFAKEIRERIRNSDAMVAFVFPPESPRDLSGYSIAVEAHEAASVGKPIAFLTQSPILVPRLLAALDHRNPMYSLMHSREDPQTLRSMFRHLAMEIDRRR
jgi:hypothetical protein